MSAPDLPDLTSTTQFAGLSGRNTGLRPSLRARREASSWMTLPLFSGMPPEAKQRFREAMDDLDYLPGEAIIEQGADGSEMYVLESGTMRVTVRNDEGTVVFERTIEAPTVFGEMALITNEPRSATITAEGACHCMRISKHAVKELFARYAGTAVFLTRLVGERLMENEGIRRVGKYEVIGRLGSGGVATVFEAIHPTLGTPVALKMLSHALVFDESFADHFAEEARLVAKLDHPHITRVIDTEQAYGTHFIVMEKLTGQLLEEVVEEDSHVTWENARRILREIAEALAYSHDMGFIHRDIKPENVFLLTDGRVKLLDFGIATHSGGGADEKKIFGTPYYMSPEQILGQAVDGRSDLYSLGILAFELLTGDIPFDGDSVQQLFARHIHQEIPNARLSRPDIPDDLIEFIAKATEKRAKDRFADLHEAARFLKVAAEVPVLERFAMSSLSVTYHESMRHLVEGVMQRAVRELMGQKGIAFFEAHRGTGPSQAVSITTGEFPIVTMPSEVTSIAASPVAPAAAVSAPSIEPPPAADTPTAPPLIAPPPTAPPPIAPPPSVPPPPVTPRLGGRPTDDANRRPSAPGARRPSSASHPPRRARSASSVMAPTAVHGSQSGIHHAVPPPDESS